SRTEPQEISVTTSSGTELRGDLYLPQGSDSAPLLLAASPYQKELRSLPVHPAFPFRECGPIEFYLEHGYAFLWLDTPGSGRSGGTFDPVSQAEGEAIAEVVEWAADQPWCSGRVGMIGQSYFCWSQWNVARVGPPHLRTIVAFDGSCDLYRDWMYKGGIPDLGFASSWTAALLLQHQATGHPIAEAGRDRFLAEMYAHPFDDDWHRTRSPFWELDKVTIPVLSIGNWAKGPLHLRGNVEGFKRLSGPKRLVILKAATPFEVQGLYASSGFHEAEILPWYERFLKPSEPARSEEATTELPEGAPVRYFVNRLGCYREAESWPPSQTRTAMFTLTGATSGATRSLFDGSLEEEGEPREGPSAKSVTWSYPHPSWRVGTSTFDDRGLPDHVGGVLTYTSAPFERDRVFSGDGVLILHASSDQDDFDVVVRLSVIANEAAGATTVTQGWLRASHRREDERLSTTLRPFHCHDEALVVEPGEIYELRVALLPMSCCVKTGERLRLEVSNGDSPLREGRLFQWYGLKVGSDTYYHAAAHPSRLLLSEEPDGQ
ncbi:MAG: CocE/NonD family hydrolase, partial [Acidimicrobiales bacterium]